MSSRYTNEGLFKLYMERGEIPVITCHSEGSYFCRVLPCDGCKIRNECNPYGGFTPMLSEDSINRLSKIYPEYFI